MRCPVFIFFLLFLGGFSLGETKKPEKFLCIYYVPDMNDPDNHDPVDFFDKECQAWCDQVLAGKDAHLTTPPPGSQCIKKPISHKGTVEEWKALTKECNQGGYKVCSYQGHSGVFGNLDGADKATEVAKVCLRSKDCKGFVADSCYGLKDPAEIESFLWSLRESVGEGLILPPEPGRLKYVKFHQMFSHATYKPGHKTYENAVTVYLYNEEKECKVGALYQPCSLSFPKETSNVCLATDQSYTCQLPNKEGKFVSTPRKEREQNLGMEICCYTSDARSLFYKTCPKYYNEGVTRFDCKCEKLECKNLLNKKCTGYQGREDRRPLNNMYCYETKDGKETSQKLCCKDKNEDKEVRYGPDLGIWAPYEKCNFPVSTSGVFLNRMFERMGAGPQSNDFRALQNSIQRNLNQSLPGTTRQPLRDNH